MKRFVAVALLILAPVFCHSEVAKIYTRRARLEDFTSKTIKVVLSGDVLMRTTLKEEISRRWYLSPFEFCTQKDYEKLKDSDKFYFLRPSTAEGICFLTITKSGKTDDKDILKRGFDVISFPVSGGKTLSAHEALFIPASIDILQRYMEKAMNSESKAYTGLEAMNKLAARGRTPAFEADKTDKIMASDKPDYVCCIAIASQNGATDKPVCYTIGVTSDTHELCYYRKRKVSDKAPAGILSSDIRAVIALCR